MLHSRVWFAIVAMFAVLSSATAQVTTTYTWTGGTNSTWEQSGNWTAVGNLPPGTFPNDNGSLAFFNNSVNTNVSLNSTVSLNTLQYGSTAGAFTIGTGGTISFASSGSPAILFNAGAAAQTINSTIALNGALAVTNNSSNAASFGGAVSGASQTLSLTSGQTTTFSGNVNLGSLVKTGSGTLTFSGSTVGIATALTLNAGITNIDTTATSTIAGNITGAGNLVKSSSSTLIFTGSNSYTGTTTISAGTLQVGSGSTTGTLGGGTVTNNAALSFNRSDSTTVANNISGSGSLTKSGAGTMTYTGAGTYTGTTTVSAGTLQVGSGSTSGSLGGGAVVNNSELAFNRSDATTVANNISGSGNLTKSGAGTLTYTGTGSYLGSTSVNVGTLIVNGALDNTGGTVTTISGATLGGTGTIARNITINSGSILRAGDSGTIGTLNITGTTTVLGAASNGGQITVRTNATNSGGDGSLGTPFLLNNNSLLALGATGTLNLDSTSGKFRIFIENDEVLAQFTAYRLTLATAGTSSSQFVRIGLPVSTEFTAADFEVYGPNSTNTYTDVQLTRSANNLILTFVTVPEPGLMFGLGAGVLALGAFLRKRFA